MPKKVTPVLLAVLLIAAVFYQQFYSPSPEVPPTPATSEVTFGATDANCEVFFTNTSVGNIRERNPEKGLIEIIDGAKESIDMALFEFDLETVKEALAKAWYRGVEIRVVYDDEYTNKDLDMKELLSLGIKGVPDERSDLMHNKFLIVDGKTVWTGSFNVTENAAHRNNENAMRIESPELAAYYTQEFEKMFGGDFGPRKEEDNYPTVTACGGAKFTPYFSPDGPKAAILEVLESADTSIHMMAFSFTDDDMGDIMIAKSRSLDVGAVFEDRGSGTEYSEFARLTKVTDGCTDANDGTFHHKVIVVDGEIVIFGSYNFSASAEEDNDENMLVVESSEIASQFEEEFQRRFLEAQASDLCVIK